MSNYTEFKVGDRVRRIKGASIGSPIGREAVISSILPIKDFYDFGSLWATFEDGTSGYLKYFELVTPAYKSPVVEKTVKTIVPGEYGNLSVYYKYQQPQTFDNLRIEVNTSVWTPDQLRHAAKVFEELAGALKE